MKRLLSGLVFCLFVFCSAPAWAIGSGTSQGGYLDPAEEDTHTFSGTAGQGVALTAPGDHTTWIAVYDPDMVYTGRSQKRRFQTLTKSGTYTVKVYFTSASVEGNYTLYYVGGGDSVSNGALSSGNSKTETLAENGLISYTFSGTSGQGYQLHTKGTNYYADARIYKPDGSFWVDGYRLINTLPDTGTYTVVVYGNYTTDSGDFDLDLVLGGEGVSSGNIGSGWSRYGLLPENGLKSYKFYGVAGQGIRLYADPSFSTAYTRVYKPDGSYWAYGSGRFVNTLPSTGTYTVVVQGSSYSYNGLYRIDLILGGGSTSEGSLISAQSRSGYLKENGLESYRFPATASENLAIASTGGFTRYIYIYKPDGSYWTSVTNSHSSLTTPSTGNYTLVLTGSSTSSTGSYSVTATTPAPTISATDEEDVERMTTPPPVEDVAMACPYTGNPIEFDVGFKKQIEVDYDAGGLTFARIYRSDSTWTDNTIGALWRHNYARSLTVGGGTAEIIDGTGAVTNYTLSGSDWIPDEDDTTATLVTSGSDYLYTLPDDTVEKYNSSGLLTRIAYRGGGALNLTYNGSSQLTGVTNENGRSLTLTYSSGRVATVVTPDGTFTYAYDGNGNLDTVTRPDTKVREYHYENVTYVNALTGITDEEGVRFATFTYDANGKGTETEHYGSTDEYAVNYNSGQTSTVTNPLGKNATYYYENIQNVRRIVQVDAAASTNTVASNLYYNYDELGRTIGATDGEGNTTRYEYDDRGNITTIAKGANSDEEQVTTITYNNTFNLPELVTEEGKTTDYDYDTYGRMTSMTVTDTATSETRITTYTYHSNTTDGSGNTVLGRLATINGPRTDVTDTTSFTYDANLNLTKITNALSQEFEITARDSAGRPTTVEDENNVETDYDYDSNGWLESATRAPGTALEAVTSFTYDANGNLTGVQLPNGVDVTYTYDDAQRLTDITDDLGNKTSYTLDDAGNITQTDIYNATPTLKYTHDQVFDELSRIIESVGASLQTAEFAYDKNSNLVTYTDPKTNDTDYAYDALQRLVETTDALSGVTALTYDDLNNLTDVEDPRTNTTTYTYNAFGDVVGESSPDRGSISYTVDKAGNITQMTDARSVVTNYTWDAINRLTDVAYPSNSALDVDLTYDLTTGCGTGVGRLCKIEDDTGTKEYQYDSLGRITDVEETRGALTFTLEYSYDLAGNISGITLPSGRTISYTRNGNGQVSGVSTVVNSTSTTLASSITYLPFGPMDALTYGNSLTFSATYDQDYYPTNRTVSGSIYNHTYDTDANGNIIQTGSTTYDYDALERLDEENSGSAVTYTYDATSNRLTKVDGGTTTTTVPAGSNKISAVGSDSYTYDSSGNITDDDTYAYTWDAANRLEEIELSGTSTNVGSYGYNHASQRTTKVVSSVTTHYVYGIDGLLYGEYDSSGNFIREYVYLNGAPLAQIDAGSPEVLTYIHVDHLGTPRFGTNSGGTQVWAWAGDAFGVGSPSGSATINLRMSGQYYDAESGIFYNWNRYYNPAIGRYISSDPIGLEGGINTFLYANASPVMYTDPTGEVVPVVAAAAWLARIGYTGFQAYRASRIVVGAETAAELATAARAANAVSKATQAGRATGIIGRAATGVSTIPAARAPQCPRGVTATAHGAERLARSGFTDDLVNLTKTEGRIFRQSDGATVFLRESSPGRFDFIVTGEKGVVTAHRNWSRRAIERIAKNYGWRQ